MFIRLVWIKSGSSLNREVPGERQARMIGVWCVWIPADQFLQLGNRFLVFSHVTAV